MAKQRYISAVDFADTSNSFLESVSLVEDQDFISQDKKDIEQVLLQIIINSEIALDHMQNR